MDEFSVNLNPGKDWNARAVHSLFRCVAAWANRHCTHQTSGLQPSPYFVLLSQVSDSTLLYATNKAYQQTTSTWYCLLYEQGIILNRNVPKVQKRAVVSSPFFCQIQTKDCNEVTICLPVIL